MASANEMDAFQFLCPFSCLIAGSSGSGKSSFVMKLIKNVHHMLLHRVECIIFCYSVYQPLYDEIKHLVSFEEGLPDITQFYGGFPTLLLMDDLMGMVNASVELLFTKLSHHLNISVIHITQNLFQGKKRTGRSRSIVITLFCSKMYATKRNLLSWPDKCFQTIRNMRWKPSRTRPRCHTDIW